jgi:TM2 domain-containing membrane protein YozV
MKSNGLAYILCFVGMFGLCGLHRIYLGDVILGVIYLVTFGLLGIGQFIDLFLIPGIVDRRNHGLAAAKTPGYTTVSSVPNFPQRHPSAAPPAFGQTPSNMQRLLSAAKAHGGVLSIAQAAYATGLEIDDLQPLLSQALKHGYADIKNDEITGAIRYHFDI